MADRKVLIAALSVAVVVGLSIAGGGHAAGEASVSLKPGTDDPAFQASVSAYRDYVAAQARSLAGMTKVLVREVEDGNLDAAQSAYAPAHRYLGRIAPIAYMVSDLQRRVDAQPDEYARKEADPSFTGFHRIEYGLFAKRSTADLTPAAARLLQDTRELRERVSLTVVTPGAMLEGVASLVKEIADKRLAGGEERYAHTDLWDLEANIDGAQEVLSVLQPQLRSQNADLYARTMRHVADFDALLAKQKDGCGFKTYDEVATADRLALQASVAVLAADLSALRGTLAMN